MKIKNLKEIFLTKYPYRVRVVNYFEESTKCELTWDNITKANLKLFVDYLRKHVSNNTARTYCSQLKSCIRLYSDRVKLPKDFEKILNIKKENCVNTFLNKDDINKIIRYKPENMAESVIKDLFLLGCLTGARRSDYCRFSKRNLYDGYITYTSQKTNVVAQIPSSNMLTRLINRLEGVERKDYCESYFNRIIKDICQKCKIDEYTHVHVGGEDKYGKKWEFVTSHTARRSFATNLYLNGAEIYEISRMCGHTSINMTYRYICCPPRISKGVIKFLNSFD